MQGQEYGQNTDKLEIEKMIDKRLELLLPKYLANRAFTEHKVTDTPTDAFNVVPKQFVTNNGSVAGRPLSSVASVGQFFLNTQDNQPMWYTSAGWVNGVASIVALNN